MSKSLKLKKVLTDNLRGGIMQRREAIQILREICECIPDASVFSCVFLIQRTQPANPGMEDFELWISADLADTHLSIVQSIVKERKLVLEENRRFFVIHEADPGETEIESNLKLNFQANLI